MATPLPEATMEKQCEEEVIRIHRFFVNWLNGTVPNSEELFARECDSALAHDMVLVKTNGDVVRFDQLRRELREAHGVKKGLVFDMEIRDFQVFQNSTSSDSCLVMYQEWHYGRNNDDSEEATSLLNDKRQCTALFRCQQGNSPHGVEWVHIHETSKRNKCSVDIAVLNIGSETQ